MRLMVLRLVQVHPNAPSEHMRLFHRSHSAPLGSIYESLPRDRVRLGDVQLVFVVQEDKARERRTGGDV